MIMGHRKDSYIALRNARIAQIPTPRGTNIYIRTTISCATCPPIASLKSDHGIMLTMLKIQYLHNNINPTQLLEHLKPTADNQGHQYCTRADQSLEELQ